MFDNGVSDQDGSASYFLERYSSTFLTAALNYSIDPKAPCLDSISYHKLKHFPTKVEWWWTHWLFFYFKIYSNLLLQDILGFVKNYQAIVNIQKYISIVLCSICMDGITHPYIGIIQTWFNAQVLHSDSQVMPKVAAYTFHSIQCPEYHCFLPWCCNPNSSPHNIKYLHNEGVLNFTCIISDTSTSTLCKAAVVSAIHMLSCKTTPA